MEHSYEFRLSAMLGRMQGNIANGDHSQTVVILLINHCSLKAPFSSRWFCVSRSHRKAALDFEHCNRERGPQRVFAGWHKAEIYAICPFHRKCHCVLSASSEWADL